MLVVHSEQSCNSGLGLWLLFNRSIIKLNYKLKKQTDEVTSIGGKDIKLRKSCFMQSPGTFPISQSYHLM